MLKLGLGLGGKSSSNSNNNNFPTALTLDAPITTALLSKTYHAFGFDRMVEGYTGDTVRLKELTGNTESDFGFDANGFFDLDAVDAWRSGNDVDVVKFYDQAEKGGVINADNTVSFIRSNVVQRYACEYDEATGLLTRSATDGGVGCDLAGVGALRASNLTVDVSGNELEVIMLQSPNTRKDIAGVDGNNTSEYLFTYGTANNNYYYHRYYGTFNTYGRVVTNGVSVVDNGGALAIRKQYGQLITGGRLNSTKFLSTVADLEENSKAITGDGTTGIAAGTMDDGDLLIGAYFADGSGTIAAGIRGNFLFGGVIITQALTDAERFMVQEKLAAIGQQHQLTSKDDIESLFDEIIYLKDVDPVTGVVAGKNGKVSLNFNTVGDTYDFEYDSDSGLRGIHSATQDVDNGFIANNTYFAGTTTGTVLSLHKLTDGGTELMTSICQDDNDGFTGDTSKSFALGFDHNCPSLWSLAPDSRDPQGVTGSRHDSNGASVGDKTANQPTGKYNRNTAHTKFYYGETFDGYTWTKEAWANNDVSAPYTFDAPTGQHTPDNLGFPVKNGGMVLQVATFEAPAGYDRADDYTIRKSLMLQATVKSYIGLVGSPIGQITGDIATNNNAAVVDSVDDAKLMSDHFLGIWQGTLFAYAFLPNVVLTKAQIEKIQVNLYKLFL